MKNWTRSDTIALAFHRCTTCHGSGMRLGRRGCIQPCNCVLRAVFRICYNRFRLCAAGERSVPLTNLERSGSGGCQHRRYTWSRKDEEFAADFYLVSKKYLRGVEWDVFRFHFLLGGDWKLCCARTGLDRGSFYHAVYRIEQKLGRRFRELQPYALYPLDEYFGGTVRRESMLEEFDYMESVGDTLPVDFVRSQDESYEDEEETDEKAERKVIPIRAPLRKVSVSFLDEEKAA